LQAGVYDLAPRRDSVKHPRITGKAGADKVLSDIFSRPVSDTTSAERFFRRAFLHQGRFREPLAIAISLAPERNARLGPRLFRGLL